MTGSRHPFVIFWSAVFIDVLALGIAWSAWKAFETSIPVLVVAVSASIVCALATVVAARLLIVFTRAASDDHRGA